MKIILFLSILATKCIHGMESTTTLLKSNQIFKIPTHSSLEIAVKVPILRIIARSSSKGVTAHITQLLNSLVGTLNDTSQYKTICALTTQEIAKNFEPSCQLQLKDNRAYLQLNPHLNELGIIVKELEIFLSNDIQINVTAHEGAIELQTDGSLVHAQADTIEYQSNLQAKPTQTRLLYRGTIGTNQADENTPAVILTTQKSICLKPIQ